MTNPSTPNFFTFELVGRGIDDSQLDRIPRDDVGRLAIVSRELQSVYKTFGEHASDAVVKGTQIVVYIDHSRSAGLAPPLDIPSLFSRTASELSANAQRESPLDHASALNSRVAVPVLRSIAMHHAVDAPPPTFTTPDGVYEVPVLQPSDFVEPTSQPPKSRTSAFEVTGISHSRKRGYVAYLSSDELEVRLTSDLEAELIALPISALRYGLWIEGTIEQSDGGAWDMHPGARIVAKESLL